MHVFLDSIGFRLDASTPRHRAIGDSSINDHPVQSVGSHFKRQNRIYIYIYLVKRERSPRDKIAIESRFSSTHARHTIIRKYVSAREKKKEKERRSGALESARAINDICRLVNISNRVTRKERQETRCADVEFILLQLS